MLNVVEAPLLSKLNGKYPAEKENTAVVEDVSHQITWFRKIVADAAKSPFGMMSQTIMVTPVFARWLLGNCNKGNRPIKKKQIMRFMEKIQEGRWKYTSQGVSFSREGLLNNGQHRLTAIASGTVSVPVYMTFGEDRSAFDVLDTGSVRGGSDTLHNAGYKNTAALASSARLLANVQAGCLAGHHQHLDNDEIVQFIEANPGLDAAVSQANRILKKFKISSSAVGCAVHLITSKSRRPDLIETFIDAVVSGAGLTRNDPILALRDGLITRKVDEHIRHTTDKAVATCAAFILAWNLWVRKRKANSLSLRWSVGQTFPQPE